MIVPVRVGAVFPQTEIGADRGAVRAWTEAVADLGFDHALIYDHVLGADIANRPGWRGPYTHETTFHEVFVVFGFMAAVAPALGLATSVLIAPQRQTALIAKQAAELDLLTGGNFRLGIGLGWNEVEYEGLGESFRTRGARLEEQIEVLRLLWREPVVTYRGRWHAITEAGIKPLPLRREIPIWFGAYADAAVDRALRLGDGLFPQVQRDPAAFAERIHGRLRELGRDPEAFALEPRVNAHGPDQEGWRAQRDEWRRLGAGWLAVNTMGDGLDGPDAHIERLRLVAEALL
jgi:probable F420-dependent oxidoreductase